MIDRLLQSHLEPIARGSQRWKLSLGLAIGWAAAAIIGLILLAVHRSTGLSNWFLFFPLLAGAVFCAVKIWSRFGKRSPDCTAVARQIEQENPELHAILLTAVEQHPETATGELNYLQQRVIGEALEHYRRSPWGAQVARQLFAARCAQWVALLCFLFVLFTLRPGLPHGTALWSEAVYSHGVEVTPGDTTLERGSSLVVLAKFEGRLPTEATLVIKPVNEAERRIPLAKNLGDPVYGGGLPEVKGDLAYHVEYPEGRTRDFKVSVYDYPKLERADAKVSYPAYTSLPEKIIPDTRRISAVEGSSLEYSFFLNKPVASAKLVARDQSVVPLTIDPKNASVYHSQFTLDQSRRYELVLVDDAGRTNKMSSEFVLDALKNRPAELKLASPRGDQRVSSLQEIAFQAEVSDDFGLRSYGVAYALGGEEAKIVELGQNTKAREKRQMSYILPLESLGAQPDQILSYYIWADDVGNDGNVRRTTSDMFFAEIKPFDEIFREGQAGDQSQQQQQQQQGQQGASESEKLADLQKQIISATWNLKRRESSAKPSEKYKADVGVVHDSQNDALQQVKDLAEKTEDPKLKGFVDAAEKAMEKAAGHLGEATDKNILTPLSPALTDEQSALQSVLRLQAKEYQVARQQNQRGQRGQQSRSRAQRQVDQLDLKQTANQYENQSEAGKQQSPEQREQLQVVNRLKELAQRQQDLNGRLKELQTALQEAKTEQEKEAIRDRLKRLREEQQDMLADVDELQQRMDKPENQSRMADERQQLEQTRSELQQASESLNQESVPQALAAGTRAQRELQQLHDDVRKKSSAQFTDEMRQMRDDARKLAQNEEQISKKLEELGDPKQKTLGDSDDRHALSKELADQKNTLTNLYNQMREVSERSEETEPVLSQQLYDTLRQSSPEDVNKSLDASSELVQRGFVSQAGPFEQKARQSIDELKRSVERAAESVLGDETEALRLAKKELEELSKQLDEELARAGGKQGTNAAGGADGQQAAAERAGASPGERQGQRGQAGQRGEGQSGKGQQGAEQQANASGNQDGQQPGGRGQRGQRGQRGERGQNGAGGEQSGDAQQASAQGQGQGQGEQGQDGQDNVIKVPSAEELQRGGRAGQRGQRGQGGQGQQGQQASADSQQGGGDQANGGNRGGGQRGANGGRAGGYRTGFDDNNYGGGNYGPDGGDLRGPLVGADYVDWSDRLRTVEEMVDVPELRTDVARIRDRARAIRLDFKRVGKKPDWAVVKTQISAPLAEVRARVDEELARRASKDALVPLDRDPVPTQYSELVRRYYEQLGKSN